MINLPPLRGRLNLTSYMDLENYLPEGLKEDFERFKEARNKGDVEGFAQCLKEKYNGMDEAQKKAYIESVDLNFKAVSDACEDFIGKSEEFILRQRLGELPEVISFSYIARKFFGKSRHWLYQRINGSTVNGKPAKFTKEEYERFISALDEIGMMISNTSASLKLN